MFIFDLKNHMKQLRAKRTSSLDDTQAAEAQKLLPFYVGLMTKLAYCERCSVFINDPAKDRVWLKAGTGVDEQEIEVPREGSIVGEVIASGKSKIVNNLEMQSGAHKQVDEETGFTTRNILCVPIKSIARNEVSGAFQLLNKSNGEEFTDEAISLVEEIAAHLQREVDIIYLDQETFGLTERLYLAFIWTALFFLISLILAAVACLALLAGLLA